MSGILVAVESKTQPLAKLSEIELSAAEIDCDSCRESLCTIEKVATFFRELRKEVLSGTAKSKHC